MIGLKNSCFPLIHLPSCYQTVCYKLDSLLSDSSISQSRSKLWFKSTNHFQSNQPISISERHETIYFSFVSMLMLVFPFFHNLTILQISEVVIFMINWKCYFVSSNLVYNHTHDKQMTPAARSSDFVITCMTGLHSVLSPLRTHTPLGAITI